MCFILLGGVLTSFFLYTGLGTMFTYIVLIFDDVCLLHLSLHVLFLFYLYTLVSTCMQSIISVSHKNVLMSIVSSVSEIHVVKVYLAWTLFLQSFSRVCVRIDFILFNKWIWVEWFMTSLIYSFICCGFVTDCQMRRLLGHMWFTC